MDIGLHRVSQPGNQAASSGNKQQPTVAEETGLPDSMDDRNPGGEHEKKKKNRRRWFICMSDIGLFFDGIYFSL
jgi:hypothetical protein